MHFCTLALPLVFFSLVFAKVVCVVFSSVLCFCVVKILDLDRRAKFFPLFFTFYFGPHLSSLSLSFLFSFPFGFFLLSFVSCLVGASPPLLPRVIASSPHPIASICYLLVLPHHFIVASSLCCCLVTLSPSWPCCLVVSLLFRCLIIVHRCFVTSRHCLVASLLCCPISLGRNTF
jgi:hypothetical protein